ncbi:MAG: ABC transporter permease, partial [Bacteroidota bacterium]
WDELSYNKYHQNYDRLARVMQFQTFNGQSEAQVTMPIPLAFELRNTYGADFKHIALSSWNGSHVLALGDKKLKTNGCFTESVFPEMLTLKMLKGTRAGLKDPSSILICQSLAKSLFGDADPMNQVLKLDNKLVVKVTGVYEDPPYNSEFVDVTFLTPWALFVSDQSWVKEAYKNWGNNSFQIFAQLQPNADFATVSAKIAQAKVRNAKDVAAFKPIVFLHPMSQWRLYSQWENSVNVGGQIEFVWLFGIIGAFVLLLACINFMNLSTARSAKRAKEVGIRKAIGSVRSQLIGQFLSESLVMVAFAFFLSLVLVELALPWFNAVADKKIVILWSNPWFWLLSLGFSLLTGFLAGSYPAFYLSSFNPIQVLKGWGTIRAGRWAAIPRQMLVVLQFTVSVTLIIGTMIVYRQIQHAKDRPIGYDRDGLISIQMNTSDIHDHYQAFRNDLVKTGMVIEVAESHSPLTGVWSNNSDYVWEGKDPHLQADFGAIGMSHEYGKTVGWKFKKGRDFSRAFATDSVGFVLNEAAMKYMGLENPIGETIKWDNQHYKVLGVIEDMLMSSPYEPVKPTIFYLSKYAGDFVNIRIHPKVSAIEALKSIGPVFQRYSPATPFDYKFVDQEFAKKFDGEERIGKLSGVFAGLAIFISCLGLFGLASFMAEQR